MPLDTTDLPIGTALKVERTVARISQQDIAREVGIHQARLSRIESGQVEVTDTLAKRIRKAIDKLAVAL